MKLFLPRLPSLALALACLPEAAFAHFFVQPYSLPVPFSMYAWGASAALLASFVVFGLFTTSPRLAVPARPLAPATAAEPRPGAGLGVGRAVSVALLLLCIVAGLVGSQNAFVNINMTLFWVVFVLGVPYAVALAGDFYAPVNPWRMVVDACESLTATAFTGRVKCPRWLGCLPALFLYMVFIALELFGHLSPRGLSVALLAYTLINVAGAYLVGKARWFRDGEFFGVMLHLIGKLSVRARPWQRDELPGPVHPRRWRLPFSGLLDEPAPNLSVVLFILFMLSSTAFDGLHATLPWVQVFWKHLYPEIASWLGGTPSRQYALSTQMFQLWQLGSLLLSPLLYLAVFAAFVAAAKAVTRSTEPLRPLVLRFAMSLVPIAFVYHVTHYYTLLLSQGGQLLRMASDPFGFGWNLFGTARQDIAPLMLESPTIWHTQVALIVVGHVVSVYLAHVESLRAFATPRRAAASQLPLLLLMMLFTTLGLWILSLPLAGGGG